MIKRSCSSRGHNNPKFYISNKASKYMKEKNDRTEIYTSAIVVNNTLSSNPWIKEEITKKIRKCLN